MQLEINRLAFPMVRNRTELQIAVQEKNVMISVMCPTCLNHYTRNIKTATQILEQGCSQHFNSNNSKSLIN